MELVSKPGLSDSKCPMPPWMFMDYPLYARGHSRGLDPDYFPGSFQSPFPKGKDPDHKENILYDFI